MIHANDKKELIKRVAAQVKNKEREISKQEKMYKKAAEALPMAIGPAFCRRIMAQCSRRKSELLGEITELKKTVEVAL